MTDDKIFNSERTEGKVKSVCFETLKYVTISDRKDL